MNDTVESSASTVDTPETVAIPDRDVIVRRAMQLPGWYSSERLQRLHALAWQTVRPGVTSRFVEVGTWSGRSAYVLAWVAAPNELLCIDAYDVAVNQLYLHGDLALQTARAALAESPSQVHFQLGHSQRLLPLLESDSWDLVHIDGDHRYEAVSSDVRHGWRITRPGGILCGDDYDETDVRRAVLELGEPQVYLSKLWWLKKPSPDGG